MKTLLGFLATTTFILFIILFDADGSQLGTTLWPNVPPALVVTAGIFGNVLWIFGALLWIVGVTLLFMINDNTAASSALKKLSDKQRKTFFKIYPFRRVWAVAIGIFAVGSSFWFFGSGYLMMFVGFTLWRRKMIEEADKMDEENGVEKPFSALDLAKSNLLDD